MSAGMSSALRDGSASLCPPRIIYSGGVRLASILIPLMALLPAAMGQSPRWVMQESKTQASLRGVSAVDQNVVWASGSGGTWLRSTDSGVNWQSATVAGAEDLDFRGLQAFSATSAILMSAGTGTKSRIYKTNDAGAHWNLLFTNPDAEGFWDSIAFWDEQHGILAGDVVAGQIAVFTTEDGGQTWSRQKMPAALEKEGAFAASNSSLTLRGTREGRQGRESVSEQSVWFGSTRSRVFRSTDGGITWTVATTPVSNTSASAGIFSLAFSSENDGVVVGGDYSKDAEPEHNIAVTADGGRTWTEPAKGPAGFRSAVLWLPDLKAWLVTGTSGSDIGSAGTWKMFDASSFNALSGKSSSAVWAVGAKGRVARLEMK